MTLTWNQLLNDDQTIGLQLLQSAKHVVAPPFVFLIAASIGHLKAPIPSREHPQQITLWSETVPVSVVRHTCL
jgi:hypothetical protein